MRFQFLLLLFASHYFDFQGDQTEPQLFSLEFQQLRVCCDRWHDAGTYSAETKTGGANGSIRNEHELGHGANSGLKIAVNFCGEDFIEVSYLVECTN